jgi:hypothetical protein
VLSDGSTGKGGEIERVDVDCACCEVGDAEEGGEEG